MAYERIKTELLPIENCTASSSSIGYSPNLAFDLIKTTSSRWETGVFPSWIKLDLGAEYIFDKVDITSYTGGGGFALNNIEIYGSIDNVNFIQLFKNISLTIQSNHILTFSNVTAYRYFRLNVISSQSGATKIIVQDISIFGEKKKTIKHLIKSSDKIQSLVSDIWTDTLLTEPLTQADFETHGMDSINTIHYDKWMELDDEFEIITFTDETEISSKFLEITTDSFSPLAKLNQEAEFEILTYTDNTDSIPQIELTVPEYKPIYLLESPTLTTWTDNNYSVPVISQVVLSENTVNYLVSIDNIVWYGYTNNQWVIDYQMTLEELHLLTLIEFTKLSNNLSKVQLYLKILVVTQNDKILIKSTTFNFKEHDLIDLGSINLTTPNTGFRKTLNEITKLYILSLDTGIAFDDVDVDYNLYTSPDKIKIRPLLFDTLVGGTLSTIKAFEVISGYEDIDFNIEMFIVKDGVVATPNGNYALLEDSSVPLYRTKIELSLVLNPFSPMYPIKFSLLKLQKKTVYIRILPQMISSGNEKFQVKLIARPI